MYDFVKKAEPSVSGRFTVAPIVRSNSFTAQDIDRQRQCIQHTELFQTHTPNQQFSISGRRMSKSLPELSELHFLPKFAVSSPTRHSFSEFDDFDDDIDSYVVQDVPTRKTWSSKADFIFTTLGFSFGLNNLWRFPYFCYLNDGGSFFAAYIILMFVLGFPTLCMEYAIGQLTQRGHSVFGILCPLLKGIVISAAFATSILMLVYSTINSWSLFYFFKSLFSIPPWSTCTNIWNSDYCILNNGTRPNLLHLTINKFSNPKSRTNQTLNYFASKSSSLESQLTNITYSPIDSSYYASQEFFDHKLLSLSLDVRFLGVVRWELVIFISVVWLSVFFALRKNIHFAAHPTYTLAIIPFMLISILFLRTLMLSGAKEGLLYLLKPTSDGLLKSEVWLYAASCCLHSLGSILGTSVASAKCNKEKNNFLRDALFVCILNILIPLAFSSIVFGTLGSLSKKRNLSISNVIPKGFIEPGLAFVAYSEHLITMPFFTFWSALFFLLMFCVGVDYQIAIVANFLTAAEELMTEKRIKEKFFSNQFFVLVVNLRREKTFKGVKLFFIDDNFQKGIIMVIATEKFITVWLTLALALLEIILIGWFYGSKNLCQMIRLKTSKAIGCYFPSCWNILIPIILILIIGSNIYFDSALAFREYKNLTFLQIIGPSLLTIALVATAVIAFKEIHKTPKTSLILRIMNTCKPKGEMTTQLKMEVIYANDVLPSNEANHKYDFAIIDGDKEGKHITLTASLIEGLNRETTI
ncbi:sodium- and chloride-dependent GABA transporter ine-like protein [Dinothrombium tinctorium]|uniref:Sodium-and chloride-dependent GABA transporter ine-like protein n=1 Tax=Dinothrombium tinctorium TaxID=1965070 RepID=A0A3S3PAR6_9ACAR|nr:sodium- and chloride-dependent GABA transporter ine-like protein [Dinothrombium tinctorium]RWS08767.1 sodium- and chloride-dependent GABA transporter ine-like protein [Dinothrombium tinctorium]